MLANSPQTNDWGRLRWAIVDSSQKPLGSPCAEEIHESRVIGPPSGDSTAVASVSPRNVPTSTLPGLIGSEYQLLGMCATVCCMLAARLPVRARQEGCFAHSAE